MYSCSHPLRSEGRRRDEYQRMVVSCWTKERGIREEGEWVAYPPLLSFSPHVDHPALDIKPDSGEEARVKKWQNIVLVCCHLHSSILVGLKKQSTTYLSPFLNTLSLYHCLPSEWKGFNIVSSTHNPSPTHNTLPLFVSCFWHIHLTSIILSLYYH